MAYPDTGKRNQTSRRGKTKSEAKKKVEYAVSSISEDGIDSKTVKNITFDKAAQEWLSAYRRGQVKESTVDQ